MNIVHIEDDAHYREAIEAVIEGVDASISVTGLHSEQSFYGWLDGYEPHQTTFIVDLSLEDQHSGFNCITEIRSSKWDEHSIIIVLTQSDKYEDIKKAERAGADFFISKDFSVDGDEKLKSLLKLILDGTVLATAHNVGKVRDKPFDTSESPLPNGALFSEIKTPVTLISHSIKGLVGEYREAVRGDNRLSPEVKGQRLKVLVDLEQMLAEASDLVEESADEQLVEDNPKAKDWVKRFRLVLNANVKECFGPENIGNAAVPTAIIFGFASLGSIIGGPFGFGAGSVFGHLITKQIKSGAAAKEIEKLLRENGTAAQDHEV